MSAFAEKFYRSTDGLRLFYRDYSGPAGAPLTLLCLPGLTRNSRDFEDVAAHYASRYRVLCTDFRGRGMSDYAKDPMTYQPPQYAEDVGRLLDAAGVAQVVFIGTSLGGLVSMICANVFRTRTKAVVINDVGPELSPQGLARIRTYLGKGAVYKTWDEAAVAIRALNAAIYPHWPAAEWLVMAKRLCRQMPNGAIRPDYDDNIAVPFNTQGPVAQVDLWPVFKGMDGLSVMAVRGELSDLLSATALAKMKAAMPGLTVLEVADVGHAPYLMEPEACSALDQFLTALEPR